MPNPPLRQVLVLACAVMAMPIAAAAQSRPGKPPVVGKAVPRGTPPAEAPPAAPAPAPTSGALTASDLLNPTVVHDLYLTVNTRDWVQLKEEFRENTYYLADLRWRDQVIRNIGIRSRGGGSRNGSKPGLRLDFNRYDLDGEFLGLKSLVLDNFGQDPSMIKERIAMRLFEEVGIRAPRVAHARLFVNNEYAGVYAMVESVDKRFLRRVFDENDGYLFEYKWEKPYGLQYLGSDYEPYAILFEPQTRQTDSMFAIFHPLREMVWTINHAPSERFAQAVGEYLDLEMFMTYIAVENFLADADGLLGKWGMNNFYLYRFEDSVRSQFIPWDKDSLFRSFDHDVWDNLDTNVLAARAMQEPALREAYVSALRRCAAIAVRPSGASGTPWLEEQVLSMAAQITEVAEADPFKPFSTGLFHAAMAELLEFAKKRPAFVLERTR